MKLHTQSLTKSFLNAVKNAIHTVGRIVAPAPRAMPYNAVNIQALLLHLCDFDQALYQYIIKWLAFPLQNPGAKMQYAIMINGPRETGSALFFERVVGHIYGDQTRYLWGKQLTELNFNDWIDDARFVIVDAALTPKVSTVLKGILSSRHVLVCTQDKPDRIVQNQMNFVLLSGLETFLPLSYNDRRLLVVEAPPARERRFYGAVAEEIANGGAAAFRAHLMSTVDLTDFNQFSEPPRPLRDTKGVAA